MTAVQERPVDAPLTLEAPAPRVLGLLDQMGLWGNLGVSLLGFTGAIFVLVPIAEPGMSLGAALVAVLVGTVLASLGLGAIAVPGAKTGAPSMVLLRGLVRDSTAVPAGVKLLEIDARGRDARWTGTDERGRAIAEATIRAIRLREIRPAMNRAGTGIFVT